MISSKFIRYLYQSADVVVKVNILCSYSLLVSQEPWVEKVAGWRSRIPQHIEDTNLRALESR